MATQVHPVDQAPQTAVRMLGESTAVVSSGAWFSAVTSAAFADMAAEAHDAGARELILDLTGVRAVDAAGTTTLSALSEQLEAAGCDVAVAATHPALVAWLTSVPLDLDLDLSVFDTVEAALADVLRRPV
ncbi:MAG: STAS domain-containing protein [Solirubrobacteraceae bacterium]